MYGEAPKFVGQFEFDLPEVMYYLYLPVMMREIDRVAPSPRFDFRLPRNVDRCEDLIHAATNDAWSMGRAFRYVYLSARKGWATPDNPLNRPGWHCDGFGTDDLNYVWWVGPGTRFAVQKFGAISDDHIVSLREFEEQIDLNKVESYPERGLYRLDPTIVHATPLIGAPGCMRQYVKVSLSNHQYNLENNSHNYLFNYDWPLHARETIRNDTHRAQLDYVDTTETYRDLAGNPLNPNDPVPAEGFIVTGGRG